MPTKSKEEAPLDAGRHNDPNYEAQFDKATSYVSFLVLVRYTRAAIPIDYCNRTFTPVPKHIQDGSEDTSYIPAAITSGAPIELQARTVRYDLI